MEDKSLKEHKKYAADIDSILKAQALIKPYVHVTPVLSSETLNIIAGKTLFFKCECFQKGGAFKLRGASNAIFSLNDEQATKGVVTHSRLKMPEERDQLSRPIDVAEAYARRRMTAGRIGILPDDSESDMMPFRWGSTPLTGGVSGQQIGLTQFNGGTTIGGMTGRGHFGMPGTASRRGGRRQNGGGGMRRLRGGRTASRSVLPAWYPRTPLGDITHVVRAIERRRERLGESDGLTLGSPTPIRVYHDTVDQDPSQIIDAVEKVFLQELHKLKRTPTAKKEEREKKVKILLSIG